MGTHPIFESDFDCLTDSILVKMGKDGPGSEGKKLEASRKKALKSALINYALKKNAELVKNEATVKDAKINERLPVLPNLQSLDEEAIRQLCRELHAQTDKTDDKRYDLEVKTQKTAKEIVELETRIKGIKDKFKKPALKRVRISADQMLKTLLGSKGKATQVDMRSQLKKK